MSSDRIKARLEAAMEQALTAESPDESALILAAAILEILSDWPETVGLPDYIPADRLRELITRWEEEAWRSSPDEQSGLRHCQRELEEAISAHALPGSGLIDAGAYSVMDTHGEPGPDAEIQIRFESHEIGDRYRVWLQPLKETNDD